MLKSKKIKYITVIGTFSIISTAYFLHANSYYAKRHPLENIKQDSHKSNQTIRTVHKQVKKKLAKKTVNPREDYLEKKKIINQKEISVKSINKPVVIEKKLTQIKNNNHIQLDASAKLLPQSKDTLEKLLPTLLSLGKDDYIELEGHSATKSYTYMTDQNSKKLALAVQNYLSSKLKDKKIIITSYGDAYPIVDDKKDERNSRVELKIRRR